MRDGNGEWAKGWREAPEWDGCVVAGLEEIIANYSEAVVWGGNYYRLPPARGWLIWDKKQEHSSGHAELAWTSLDIPVRTYRLSRVEAYSKMHKQHPTQKPVGLMRWCIEFTKGQAILDPFMGSGTTLVAAKQLGRRAIGIEIEEKYCEIAANRLANEPMPLIREEVSA